MPATHAAARRRHSTEGKGLNIGYFAQQELDVLRPQDNPLEHMVRLARESWAVHRASPAGEQALRGFLGSFTATAAVLLIAIVIARK